MNRDALETLVRRHQAELYRYVRYLGADVPTAEDLVQDTFMAAFRSSAGPAIDDVHGTAAWLRGIARNLFLRHCRRSATSRVRADSELVEQAEDIWSKEFLRGADGFDYAEALRKCLQELPDRQRQALDMRYAARKSRAEMAESLSMTQHGVKSLLRRIRVALAACVKRRLAMGRA